MELKILYKDGREEIINIRQVTVLNTIVNTQFLYYETHNDHPGYGTRIPMDIIKGWVANAVIKGGNIKL